MKAVFATLFAISLASFAHADMRGLKNGATLKSMTLLESVEQIQPGDCVIIGENHGFKTHQSQQLQILQALRDQGLKVSVGMEFFTYTDQQWVDQYRTGDLTEELFLQKILWGSPSFSFYRDQVQFPNATLGEKVWALNAPREITSQVAKKGLNSLSAEQAALLPPDFTLGRESYKNRFLKAMPHLPSPEAGDRYFAAQSIWDDTMAWRAADFIEQNPDQVLVIIVGEFHTQYGGGLPHRLGARNPAVKTWTYAQIQTGGLTSEEIAEQIKPSAEDGPRADFLWLADAL